MLVTKAVDQRFLTRVVCTLGVWEEMHGGAVC